LYTISTNEESLKKAIFAKKMIIQNCRLLYISTKTFVVFPINNDPKNKLDKYSQNEIRQ